MKAVAATVLCLVLLCCVDSGTGNPLDPDREAVVAEIAQLDFATIAGANTGPDNVRFDLSLPLVGNYETAISWSSTNEATIGLDGKISRSTVTDIAVTLTAHVSKGGYTDSKAFDLLVIRKVAVTWGNVQHPSSVTTTVGVQTDGIYGQVYAAGVTDSSGQGSGIIAQLGYGLNASDPTDVGWVWIDASYDADAGSNDEYVAKVTVSAVGTYAYAYRYSGDDGTTWVYCDTNGTPYNSSKSGVLTVTG
jgi:hypothetical protein